MICNNILDAIGNTPLIRLSRIAPPDGAEILVKYEGLNVGGSIKTRTAYNMICDAEARGLINKDTVTIMLDTSGAALHKRGYRPESNAAPLRETLAAAMVNIARLREDVLLWDPFCGSGTIAIEGAMMVTNTAPGANRSFSAESFDFVDNNIWKIAREEAKDLQKTDSSFQVYASDIDPKCVSLTKNNAKRAGVFKNIRVFAQNALDIKNDGIRGTVVCNPPYGERLLDIDEVTQLYRQMGKVFTKLAPWQIYILSSVPDFEKIYGKRADKVRKFYNGKLKCNYYQYFKQDGIKPSCLK